MREAAQASLKVGCDVCVRLAPLLSASRRFFRADFLTESVADHIRHNCRVRVDGVVIIASLMETPLVGRALRRCRHHRVGAAYALIKTFAW